VRRKLLIVLLGTVTLALLAAGFGTYTLLRREDRSREIERLQSSSKRMAENTDAVNSLNVALDALNLISAARVQFPATKPKLDQITYVKEIGLPLQSLVEVTRDWTAADFAAVAKGETVARVSSGLTWSVAPVGRVDARTRVDATTDPLATPDQFEAIVLVGPFTDTARRAVELLALGSLGALLLTFGAAVAIAQNISSPLRAATAAYQRIASGDLNVRVANLGTSSRPNSQRRKRQKNQKNQGKDEVSELLGALDVMAESLQRARDQERQFLLSVSHDLRTPLTSIRGYAEALADGTVEDPGRSAEVIVSESRRLERLVKDLLDLAKLQSNQFTLNPKSIDLTDLVTDIADGFLPAAKTAGLALHLEAESDIRRTLDPDRVAQLMANLVENALKYARHQVTVGLCVAPAGGAQIWVADDGPGISNDDLPRVFERSFTSDRQETRKIGSGLGLAIVQELAHAMSAKVDIQTQSTGTTFTVRW
jgi:signal transduction histidine kinase